MKFHPKMIAIGSAAFTMLAMAFPSYSAPNIASVAQSADTLTVRGSAFGTHANYGRGQPFLNAAWNNFESGNFNSGNVSLDGVSTSQWSIATAQSRPNSTRFAQKVFKNDELGELAHEQSGTTGKWFVSFWMRVGDAAQQQSGKFFRIYGNAGNIYTSTGGGNLNIRGFSECTSCAPSPTTVWGSANSFAGNTWQRVDIEISQNPDWFAVYLDGRLQWKKSSTSSSSAEREQWLSSAFGANGHTLGIGQMLDGPERGFSTNGFYNFDDFYVDYTWSRVELCNSPTWSSCSVREIQIPTAWSDSSISVQLNKGSFSNGQTGYLFVVDASGTASGGYPITIGGGSSSALPVAQNLHVISTN